MSIPAKSKFPSALQREHGGNGSSEVRRRGPTSSEIAMMDAETYKRYMQGRGEWESMDRAALGRMKNPETRDQGRD